MTGCHRSRRSTVKYVVLTKKESLENHSAISQIWALNGDNEVLRHAGDVQGVLIAHVARNQLVGTRYMPNN